MIHLVNFLKKKNVSKETIWAGSIIIVCVLAGCFLLIKTITEKSEVTTFSPSAESIELFIENETTVSESTELLTISENAVSKFTESTLETENSHSDSTNVLDESDMASSVESQIEPGMDSNYDCPIDFEALWKTNEDVYAWISIPGTVIDYPILQHDTDNSYYLNYTIDGIEGYPGSIYTENVNAKDFTDNNTVIYGHNMRNGTMFTDLHKFRDTDFFKEHDTVSIYTPKKELTYKIFAAYLYDDRHLTNSFDFSDPIVYADYLAEIQNQDFPDANFREDITVTGSDKIITLITCIREQPEKRVYVQAVLLPDNDASR